MPKKISESVFRHACDLYLGWCSGCQDFTTESCEPDAEDYECSVCGERTVVGAENAIIGGLFEIETEGGDAEAD